MKFDYYFRHHEQKGTALKDLAVFFFGDIFSPLPFFAPDPFLSLLVFFINPIACFISGYRYLDDHGFHTLYDGCFVILIMAPIRFIVAPIVGFFYYPYLVISAFKRIF